MIEKLESDRTTIEYPKNELFTPTIKPRLDWERFALSEWWIEQARM